MCDPSTLISNFVSLASFPEHLTEDPNTKEETTLTRDEELVDGALRAEVVSPKCLKRDPATFAAPELNAYVILLICVIPIRISWKFKEFINAAAVQ